MAEPWTAEFGEQVRRWCRHVAALGVDVLVDAGVVARADLDRATAIVAEEVLVRLCLLDYPPLPDSLTRTPDAQPSATTDRDRK